MKNNTVVIIGAGPAGLTAAYELLARSEIHPIVLEATQDIGGISKTVEYKGNRIDIGGHRFFSKSERVMRWWSSILPVQTDPSDEPPQDKRMMLIRKRLSRIFFLRKFFDYPVSLNLQTILNLGFIRIIKIGFSYLGTKIHPIKYERSLEDFFINRFGKELYRTFFQDYTEKVWGVPCRVIKPEWGAQRIKGLSVTKTILHALRRLLPQSLTGAPKNVETSLIEQFIYPALGPGQMWEEVAAKVQQRGGEVRLGHRVIGINHKDEQITGVQVRDEASGEEYALSGDYYFSTMPVRDLILGMDDIPKNISEVAEGLQYRDFITVGLLLKDLAVKNTSNTTNDLISDNWIYIQERDVKVGRLQIFNNWSPFMVKDPNTVWIGLEYFCNEGDDLWVKTDAEFSDFAAKELAKIGIIKMDAILDSVVIRMKKAYPAYFGSYERFDEVKTYLERFPNLFLIGRNGMHRYNNMDHSMLTAMVAVDNILENRASSENLWTINAEEAYHEETSSTP